MIPDRRTLLAAAMATALPTLGLAAPKRVKPPKPCVGRVAYAGPPLRAQIGGWQFDAAAKAGRSRLAPITSDALEGRFEQAAKSMRTTALTAALATADGSIWTQTLAGKPGDPAPGRFDWAGLTDAYTATAILQLAEERKLTLDAPLSRWAPEARNAFWITLEDLLAHTDGPQENICPGAGWASDHAGYAHLGRIIEVVDGKPWREAMKSRIVDRLDLRETEIHAPDAPVSASSGDAVKFWRALMSDRLHGAEQTRRRFLRLYPMPGRAAHYGLGVMVNDPSATDAWLGYSSEAAGAKAMIAYSVEKQAFVAVALTGEGSPEATAKLLLAGLPKKG